MSYDDGKITIQMIFLFVKMAKIILNGSSLIEMMEKKMLYNPERVGDGDDDDDDDDAFALLVILLTNPSSDISAQERPYLFM